jgi:hypothetical protein
VKPGICDGVRASDEELRAVLKCMGTTRSICFRDHTIIAHISRDIDFCTYVDKDYFASENTIPPQSL